LDEDLLREARSLGSATLYEAAGQNGALPAGIKPVAPGFRVAGPALTVACPPADNLWLHRALVDAAPAEVLVVTVGGEYEAGYWGEVMTVSALARGVAGLVIDGMVRDADAIAASAFPVFARGLSIRGTRKDPRASGALRQPISIGDVAVEPGDLVVGDRDGIVVVPRARAREVIELGRERERREAEIMERLREGETTLEIYGFARDHLRRDSTS
jgi:4-hydroxy-4-methyl-2-oxoglutarate aldolase